MKNSEKPQEETPLLRLNKVAQSLASLPRFSSFINRIKAQGITLPNTLIGFTALLFACASTAVFWPSSIAFRATPLGEWFTTHIFDAAIISFLSSAPDLFLLTAFLTLAAWPIFMKVFSAQDDTFAKVCFVFSVGMFTLIQAIQAPAVVYGTGGSLVEIFLAGIGGVPGAFFAGTMIVSTHIFSIARIINSIYLNSSKYLLESWLGTFEKYHFERELIYLQAQLIRRLNAGYANLLASQRDINLPEGNEVKTDSQLIDVWQQMTSGLNPDHNYASKKSWSDLLKLIAVVSVIAGTAVFCMAFILNMIHSMPKILPIHHDYLSIILGSALTLATTFLFTYINTGSISSVYDILHNLLTGKPVENTTYQLHPRTSIALPVITLAWNFLSWYTSYNLLNRNYSDNWPIKHVLLSIIIPIVILYHVAGVMKFFSLVSTKLAKNSGDPHQLSLVMQDEAREKANEYSSRTAIKLISGQESHVQKNLLGKNPAAALEQLMKSKAWNAPLDRDAEKGISLSPQEHNVQEKLAPA